MSDPTQEAQSTGSMWGSMFGLGPLMRLISDPELSQNANKVMRALIAGQAASQRVEAKLDFLLKVLGHDPQAIAPDDANGPGRGNDFTALLARLPDGNR